MRKSLTTTRNIFSLLLLLFYVEKFIFCQKTHLEKLGLCCYICITMHESGYWKYRNKTPTSIQICIGLVDTALRSKILGNRLGILMQILIAMDYYFLFFYISEKYFQFRKKQKHLLRKTLVHPIQVTGSTYCHIVFQTMYIILKICT